MPNHQHHLSAQVGEQLLNAYSCLQGSAADLLHCHALQLLSDPMPGSATRLPAVLLLPPALLHPLLIKVHGARGEWCWLDNFDAC